MMKYKITLNNRVYEVEVEQGEAILQSEYDAAAPGAGLTDTAIPMHSAVAPAPAPATAPNLGSEDGEAISAPLPGTVLRINVESGDAVKKGQVLLIIEAMKMETEVVASRNCSVLRVVAAQGKQVKTGDPLVIIA